MLNGHSTIDIAEKFLKIPRSSLQVHLERLIETGLVEHKRTRKESPYSINTDLITKVLNTARKIGVVMSKLARVKELEKLGETLTDTEYGIDNFNELSEPLLEKAMRELEIAKKEYEEALKNMD